MPAKHSKYANTILRGLKYACENLADEAYENADLSDRAIMELANASDEELKSLVESMSPKVTALLVRVFKDARDGARLIEKNESLGT